MLLTPFEWMIAKRYMLPGKGERMIALVASIGVVVVMLSVALLIVVMSVMNGFRAELVDKIVGLNGHAIVQAYGGRLENWQDVLRQVKATPGVTQASPLIEQPLLTTFNGRVEAILLRGNTPEDIARIQPKVVDGDIMAIKPEGGTVAIGARLAENLGARVGDTITIINPQGQSTPFGTVPREIAYRIDAIFEIGIYDYDERFVVMPMQDAQTLLLTGDSIGMIEVKTEDADTAAETLEPIATQLEGKAVVSDWKTINSGLFEAIQVERVAMFFALSLIVLVAAFNILSSLAMMVHTKSRDIAIMRTMGATRKSMLRTFVTAGTVVGTVGAVSGALLGFLILIFRQPIVKGLEIVTGQSLWDPKIRFLTELPARTDPLEVVAILGLAVGLSFLATLYPAFRAASTDPVQVLRYE
ncbi:MAG: lipoprotein-releasing ABC transporter permease subunit [Novosphingobium sp.]